MRSKYYSEIIAKFEAQGVTDLQTLNKMTNADFKDCGVNIATREKIRDLSMEVYKAFPKKPKEIDDDKLKKLCFSSRDIEDGEEFWVDVSLEGSGSNGAVPCLRSVVCSDSFEGSEHRRQLGLARAAVGVLLG